MENNNYAQAISTDTTAFPSMPVTATIRQVANGFVINANGGNPFTYSERIAGSFGELVTELEAAFGVDSGAFLCDDCAGGDGCDEDESVIIVPRGTTIRVGD